MRHRAMQAAIVVVGFLLGAGAVLAFQQPQPTQVPSALPPDEQRAPADASFAKPGPVPEPQQRLLLAWTPGGLPSGFAADVAALPSVVQVTEVRGGLLELTGSRDTEGTPVDDFPDGWVVPLDAIAVDPPTYATFVPKSAVPAFSDLGPGQALLSETGAELRGLDEGASLDLVGRMTLTVAGIVDDAHAAGAEVVLSASTAQGSPAATPRYLLVSYIGDRAGAEDGIRRLVDDGPALRLRGPGETPVLRHGDAVLPQAEIKKRFGEFAYRRGPGRGLEQDPAWIEAHITTADVPIIGTVRCHRAVLPILKAALADLEREHLGHTINPDGYAGCHEPRLISSQDSVSRHAWGIALDINVDDNPVGQASAQDPRLVATLERWGFGWGGHWLVPDPAHFEYLRPPAPGADGGR